MWETARLTRKGTACKQRASRVWLSERLAASKPLCTGTERSWLCYLLPVGMINQHKPKWLIEEFIWLPSTEGESVRAEGAWHQETKTGTVRSNHHHTQKAEKATRKWSKTLNHPSPPPSDHFIHKAAFPNGFVIFLTSPTNWELVFKCSRSWGTFFIQTTTLTKLSLAQVQESNALHSFWRFFFSLRQECSQSSLLVLDHLWQYYSECSYIENEKPLQARSRISIYCLGWWQALALYIWLWFRSHTEYKSYEVIEMSTKTLKDCLSWQENVAR